MASTPYIYKNRHQTYYFRIIIPKDIRDLHSNKREIRRSLKTQNKKTACIRSRLLWAQYHEIFNAMKKRKKNASSGLNVELFTHTDAFGHKETYDLGDPILESKLALELNRQKQETLSNNPELLKATINSRASDDYEIATFEEVTEYFLKSVRNEKKLSKNTFAEYEVTMRLLNLIAGEVTFGEISKIEITKIKDKIYNIPKNLKQKQLTDAEVTCLLNTPSEDFPTISHSTAAAHVQKLKKLCKFAYDSGYHIKDLMDGQTIASPKKPEKERLPFNKDDLTKILQGHVFQPIREKRATYKPFHYWLPLLAMYTGARLEELCQLTTQDILKDPATGITYLNITDIAEDTEKITKSLKNQNSRRRVPIHSKLAELKFPEYCANLAADSEEYIFDLTPNKKGKRGSSASSWFNRDEIRKPQRRKDGTYGPERRSEGYAKKCGIVKSGKGWSKSFHSFRHTFIDGLRASGVETSKIAAIVGHEPDYKITNYYGDGFSLETIKKEIDKLDYSLAVSPIDYSKFQEKIRRA